MVSFEDLQQVYRECGNLMKDFITAGIKESVVNEKLKQRIINELDYIANRMLPALSIGVNADWEWELQTKGRSAVELIVKREVEYLEESLMDYVYSLLFGSPYRSECDIRDENARELCEKIGEFVERLTVNEILLEYKDRSDMFKDIEALTHYIREGIRLLEGCLIRKLRTLLF